MAAYCFYCLLLIAGCLQADVPVEVYWSGGRSATVAAEGRKAESYLLRAQQAAKETYHSSLVRLVGDWHFGAVSATVVCM